MNTQTRFFFGILLAGASVAAVACSDDSDSTTSTTATTATSTSTTTSTASGGGNSGEVTCEQACTDLYNCGLEKDGAAQLCAGFKGGDEAATFVNGTMSNGCAASCEEQPALKALVKSDDCKGTISALKGINPQFKDVCDNGLSSGSGAGGAGAGGAGQGGAGGN
jgi:hypothetical protein